MEVPDLLFDRSLIPTSSNRRHPDLFEIRRSNGDLLARSGAPIPAEFEQGRPFANFVLSGISYRAIILRQAPGLEPADSIRVPERGTGVYRAPRGGRHDPLMALGCSAARSSLLLLAGVSGVAGSVVGPG